MSALAEPMHALGCFNCSRESPAALTSSEAEALAGAAGWVLGLNPDGEHADAEYACDECADLLVDPHPVTPLRGIANGAREDRAAEHLQHAASSTPTLQRIGETPQAIFLALLVGLAILGLAACGNFQALPDLKTSTLTLPGSHCARGHKVQQTGTMGAYGTPVVVVTDEPCQEKR